MFPMFNAILDGLTYKDLAGKRQPRAFTVLTGLILLIVSMAGGLAFLNRIFLMSKVQATPVPLSLTVGPTQIVEVPRSEPTQQAVELWDGCPTNAEDWSFSPTYNGQPYNVIQPACVYQGLEKTIAWALAVREGYSRAEATQQLGFTEMPMRRLDQVTIQDWSDWYDKPLLGCMFYDLNYDSHTGADFPVNEGTSIYTTISGKVVWADENGPWGNLVVIENEGYQVWLAHLSSITVTPGEIVDYGDEIGLSGNTGNSTGGHLHYGIKHQTEAGSYVWLDPHLFFTEDEYIYIGCSA